MGMRHLSHVRRLTLGVCLLAGLTVSGGGSHGVSSGAALSAAQLPPQTGRAPRPVPTREREHVVEGTKQDDVVDGTDRDEWMFGAEGNDVLRGGAGRDTLDGGAGDDWLTGGAGHDVLDGGAGRDTLSGGDDDDFIDGGEGDDAIDGGAGNDDIDGGDGDDLLTGGPGDDVLVGGDGNDTQFGGDGADRVVGRDNDDRLSGGAGDDRLEGNDGGDWLSGDAGNDHLDGGDGDDVAAGGIGDDRLDGGSGADALSGDSGNDTVVGSGGGDMLAGGDGHDTMLGGDGPDAISGGAGDDVLIGGSGADVLRGDSEADVIVIRAGDVGDGLVEWIDGGAGSDTLVLNGFRAVELTNQVTDPATGGIYRVNDVEQLQHAHVFTTLSSTDEATTAFTLINPAAAAARFRILFFDSEGRPRAAAINKTASSHHSFSVGPRSRITLPVSGISGQPPGSALVLSDQPLTGYASTAAPVLGTITADQAPLLDAFVVPVRQSRADRSDTGVAVFASTVASRVKLTLRRSNGQEMSTPGAGAVEVDVPANGHRVIFVSDTFAWAGEEFEGSLTVEGGIDRPQEGGPVAGVGLRRDTASGIALAFPVLPVAPAPARAPAYAANVPIGGEYRTSIALVNPSPVRRARGTLLLLDESGQARSASINGQAASTSAAWELGPLGSAVFNLTAPGSMRPGSARVITAEGVTGGVVSISSPTATAMSPLGEAIGSFAAPAARSRQSGITTALALHSTVTAQTVVVSLRDGSGAEISGGRAQLAIAANAALTRTIDVIFPAANLDEFVGTLTVEAADGMVAAGVMQHGVKTPAIVSLPIVRLRE